LEYRRWTEKEMFLLLQYPIISIEELSNQTNRSEAAVQSKIQDLNLSNDYRKTLEKFTIEQFCSDCTEDPKTCGRNPIDCLKSADAQLYKRYYNIIINNKEVKPTKIIKKNKKIEQRKQLIS
jgi:hypothetical protein